MIITRKTDYALRLLYYLARRQFDGFVSIKSAARDLKIPEAFTAKILTSLSHKGFLKPKKGSEGGYILNIPPHEISFKDVIEIIEGPIALNECLMNPSKCQMYEDCDLFPFWAEIQDRFLKLLDDVTVGDVLES